MHLRPGRNTLKPGLKSPKIKKSGFSDDSKLHLNKTFSYVLCRNIILIICCFFLYIYIVYNNILYIYNLNITSEKDRCSDRQMIGKRGQMWSVTETPIGK